MYQEQLVAENRELPSILVRFYGCTSWSTLCEILMTVGNSTWLLGQILALSVSNTVM